MSRAILRRDLRRDRGLVLAPTAEFLESQSHRLDILLPRIAHQTDEGAGVDSAGKECANRDIGHEMMAHAVEERLPDTELQILIACGRARGFRIGSTCRRWRNTALSRECRRDPPKASSPQAEHGFPDRS